MKLAELRKLGAALHDAFKCPTCGKSRFYANTAGYRRPAKPETHDPKIHCDCVLASPAAEKEKP